MCRCSDENDLDVVARFVIWGIRYRDLPADVEDAAMRLAATGDYPRPDPVPEYIEGSYRVTAFPADETIPLQERRCQPHQLGAAVEELIAGARYLLIDDLGAAEC